MWRFCLLISSCRHLTQLGRPAGRGIFQSIAVHRRSTRFSLVRHVLQSCGSFDLGMLGVGCSYTLVVFLASLSQAYTLSWKLVQTARTTCSSIVRTMVSFMSAALRVLAAELFPCLPFPLFLSDLSRKLISEILRQFKLAQTDPPKKKFKQQFLHHAAPT